MAKDGAAALQLDKASPKPDLMLDVIMPGPRGYSCQVLKADPATAQSVEDLALRGPAMHRDVLRFLAAALAGAGVGGTGLGLAIVKHVLKRHRAHLYIESTLGKGSLFRCDFPPEIIVTEKPAADLNHSA